MTFVKYLKSILPHKIKDKYHYGRFIGSFNFLRLLSWNLCHPNRLINRIRWNALFNFSTFKKKKYRKYNSIIKSKNNKLENNLGPLLDNGGLLINDYFNNSLIDSFLNEYKDLIESEKKMIENKEMHNSKTSNNIYAYRVINLHLSKALIDIWLNEEIVSFLEHYLGTKIYAREYPRLVYTKYFYDDNLKSIDKYNNKYKNMLVDVPYFWHTDHTAGLISLHILLEDVDLKSTHMQYLPGSNKYLNSRDLYSDETISKFAKKPIDCIGKKGTIYFHSGNTLHRVVGRKNSSRLSLILCFSPGSGIEFDCERIATALSKKFRFEDLTQKKREILSGIYPRGGGYNLINNSLLKDKFNEQIK